MDVTRILDRYFGITNRGSSIPIEIKGGILVFFSMIYVIAVNTSMMATAGVPSASATTVTIIMAVVGSVLMGLYAKFPAALAPGMSINAMVCYTVVLGMGFTWQEALVGVILSGLVFLVLTLSGLRKRLLAIIPMGMKSGMVAGIGCFIALIGLNNSGIIAIDGDTLLPGLGNFSDPSVLLALFCVVLTLMMYAWKPSLGILVGMVTTVLVGMFLGIIDFPSSILAIPAPPPVLEFIDGISMAIVRPEFVVAVVSIMFVELFDGSGTLIGIALRGGMTDSNGNLQSNRPLNVDAGIASLSGVMGSTPTSVFAESTVGIESGARTGLMALTVAMLFFIALFVAPVFEIIGYECTVGAMVIVGISMSTELMNVDWKDKAIAAGVITTVLMMVLTYSITNGIALGFIVYCLVMVGLRRFKDISVTMYILAAIFAVFLFVYTTSF